MRLSWKLLFASTFITYHNAFEQEGPQKFVWRKAENGMLFSIGCSYSDFDYLDVPSNSSDCSQKCYEDLNCTHFSWNDGKCFLKKNVAPGTTPDRAHESSRCGFRGPGKILNWQYAEEDQLQWARGCHFEYNNLKLINRKTADECVSECLNNPDCSHFSWSWFSDGTCWLKQNFPPGSEPVMKSQEFICGFKTQVKFEFDENHNLISPFCDFKGKTFMDESTKTAHDCSELCMDNTSCTHFSYTDEDGGHCFLKNGVPYRTRAVFTRHFNHCGFKYVSPDQVPTNCHAFTERRGNFCNVNVEVVVNKKKLL